MFCTEVVQNQRRKNDGRSFHAQDGAPQGNQRKFCILKTCHFLIRKTTFRTDE